MKQRIITGVLFALAVAAFIIPGYWFWWPPLLFFSIVAVLVSYEIVTAFRQCGRRPCLPVTLAGSLFMLIPWIAARLLPSVNPWADILVAFSITLFLLFILMTIGSMIRLLIDGPKAFPDAVATAGIMLYIAFPLTCAVLLLTYVNGGWLWVVIGLAAPWFSDVFSYFTGSLIGRHRIVPLISPKKTVEGSLGGIAGSMLSQMLIFYLFQGILGKISDHPVAILLFALASGLLLSISAQLGDWFASGFKRYCSIKDFGNVLPGHGGLMDRFDSAFFTMPVTFALALVYQLIGS